jgi:homoserine dehydrogenase
VTGLRAVAQQERGWAVDLWGAGTVGGRLLPLFREAGVPVASIHRRSGTTRFEAAGRSVFVDATPPAFSGPAAEAWVVRIEEALARGTPVVTCNKAPLALAWARLDRAARDDGVPFVATATVGGGTPILPALRGLHAERGVTAIEATLSGTLGLVVPLVKAGASLADAVAQAQAVGYCEPDPTVDLDGTDAWAKACILHNALWPEEPPIGLRDRPAPLALRERDIRSLDSPAVVANLGPGRVSLELRDWAHGPDGGICVRAEAAGGTVALSGAGAGPEATARVLVADVLAVAAGRLPPGIR